MTNTGRAAQDVDTWFAGAQQGDPAALDGLLRAVSPTAQWFAARSCSTREDAEDAAQEALSALARRVGPLRAAEPVRSWMFIAIRHACLRRAPGVVLVSIDVVPGPPGADFAAVVVDRLVVAEALATPPGAG